MLEEKSLIRKKEIEEKEAAKAAVEPARGSGAQFNVG